MENHLGELKAVFDFLIPGYLGSDEFFKRKWLKSAESNTSSPSDNELQKLIHPFKMRRTKELVLKDLPEKVEDLRHCMLSDEQASMYKQTIDMKVRPLMDIVKDETKSVPFLHVFAVLTLLKQICDHPALLRGKTPGVNATAANLTFSKSSYLRLSRVVIKLLSIVSTWTC